MDHIEIDMSSPSFRRLCRRRVERIRRKLIMTQTFVVDEGSFRFTPDAAMAAPTAVSLSYIAAV